MSRLFILALSLGLVAAPGAAMANWVGGTVTFERPVRSDKAILASESLWRCEGAVCRGRTPARLQSAERYCRELGRWGGTIVSFQAGTVLFDAQALRRCNGAR